MKKNLKIAGIVAVSAALAVGVTSFLPARYELPVLLLTAFVASVIAIVIFQYIAAKMRETQRGDFLELMLKNTSDLVALVDLDGRRIYNNAAYGTVLSDPAKLRGTDSFSEIHPGDRERVREIFRRTIETGAGERAEYRFLRPDGTVRYIESQGDVMRDEDGKPSKVIIVSRDVTERKKLEEELRQSQKMDALGQLAGGVAHDFNNMILAINGYAGFIAEQCPAGSQIRADAGEIAKAADRAAALSRQLLAFSRKQILSPKVVDLNKIAAGLEKMLGRLLGPNVTLQLAPYDFPALIKADPGQIEQVLLNLSLNARDAMPDGGNLAIKVFLCEYSDYLLCGECPPGRYACVSVADTGTGIPPAIQSRIFEPFFTTKKAGKGTGLGLSTAYGIVKQSGGHIAFQSAPGKGATFTVYLPLAEGCTEDVLKDAPAPVTLRGTENILLVEDNPVVRSITRRTLQEHGYNVFEAASDSEALLQITSKGAARMSLLLLDIVLPGMNGFELAERISVAYPGIARVYMSGHTDPDIIRPEMLKPEYPFLAKPFTAEELLTAVRRALDAKKGA